MTILNTLPDGATDSFGDNPLLGVRHSFRVPLGSPHQQGFRPFRTPPPACSLSSLRDFGGTFADSRKKNAYGTKKIALLLTAVSPL